jgi:hypothetical protein
MCEIVARTAASTVVAGVLNVPAFAQTNTAPWMLAFERSAAGVVREYIPGDRSVPGELSLPANLEVPAVFRGTLESMLSRSPTFRQQCRRLAHATSLTVRMHHAAAPLRGAGARTRIVRRPDNTLEATVEISRLGSAVELIAHEIEHVIEQLDEIDLPSRAAVSGSGVSRAAGMDASFETKRAIRVGLKVAQEVRSGGG